MDHPKYVTFDLPFRERKIAISDNGDGTFMCTVFSKMKDGGTLLGEQNPACPSRFVAEWVAERLAENRVGA